MRGSLIHLKILYRGQVIPPFAVETLINELCFYFLSGDRADFFKRRAKNILVLWNRIFHIISYLDICGGGTGKEYLHNLMSEGTEEWNKWVHSDTSTS